MMVFTDKDPKGLKSQGDILLHGEAVGFYFFGFRDCSWHWCCEGKAGAHFLRKDEMLKVKANLEADGYVFS